MKKLLRLNIQDGENTYYEFFIIKDLGEVGEIIDSYGGFMIAVKDSDVKKITDKEEKTLLKLEVV